MKTHSDILDMRPDGSFVDQPGHSLGAIAARVIGFGVLLYVAVAVFWATVLLLPVILLIGLIGGLLVRAQLRRGRIAIVRRGGRF